MKWENEYASATRWESSLLQISLFHRPNRPSGPSRDRPIDSSMKAVNAMTATKMKMIQRYRETASNFMTWESAFDQDGFILLEIFFDDRFAVDKVGHPDGIGF